jgi:L-asparaginase II
VSAASGIVRVDVKRGGSVESRHEVEFAIGEAGGAPLARDAEPVFLRSSAKPFQAAAVVASGAADRFGMSDEEIAIAAASHAGEDRHTRLVARLLAKIGVSDAVLGCGAHPPFDAATATRVGAAFTSLHHNCSGKHAAMIALAIVLGVEPRAYLDPEGRVQQTIRRTVALACGLAPDDVVTAIDGCSALTFAVPLAAAARAFARLSRPARAPDELRESLERVVSAMVTHPHLVGGAGRFDTRLMEAARGALVSKAGAEGVQGVGNFATGEGLCLKVRDGTARAVAPATLELLRHENWLDASALDRLRDEWHPTIVNFTGRTVGEIVAGIA